MSVPDQRQSLPIPLPQVDEISKKERDDAMGAYFMTFATLSIGAPLPLLSLIVSVIYHLVNARKSRFVAFHSLQSLLSEIPISICNATVIVWGIAILVNGFNNGFAGTNLTAFWYCLLFTFAITIVYIIFSLIAAFRAQKGRFIYFWLIGPLVYRHYYILGKGPREPAPELNLPPAGF